MNIINKNKFIAKHIGLFLLCIGLILTFGQVVISDVFFPASTIVTFASLVFQLIGWNEPHWFLLDKYRRNIGD